MQLDDDQAREALQRAGIWRDDIDGNPALHVGAAMAYALHYGVQFAPGPTPQQVRAILPPERWEPGAAPDVAPITSDRSSIQLAVIGCLLQAARAGILPKE